MSGATDEGRVLGFAEALKVVLRHAAEVHLPGAERIALRESAQRVLAEEVRADRDQPPFERATRDGFAVRAEEWSAGRRLRVVGQVRAGEAWAGAGLLSGESIEIMTGAPVPEGADAVAMLEYAELRAGEVWAVLGRSLVEGENIVRRGSEARQGESLLAAGTTMGAAEIALTAVCGYVEIAVYKRPVVAILTTGDELVELDTTPGDAQIRNSNSTALATLVEAAGGRARQLAIARDSLESLRERITEGRGSDLLLLSGGVSAGRYDLVEEVLAELGAEFFFTGVRMQPGRTVVFGRLPRQERSVEGTYFFGLPGNPVSTQVTFHCFVAPMLRAVCGAGSAEWGPRFVQASLAEAARGKAGLTRILPAVLRHDFERPEVLIIGSQGSGDLTANARANCYAVLADGRDLNSGDVISVLLR
jgi:molybdopterin molybdotransferase